MTKTTIIIDSREQKMLALAKQFKIPHTVEAMQVGDYGLRNGVEWVCVIERKTVRDLLNAVLSKQKRKTKDDYHRFTSQLNAMHAFPCKVKAMGIVGAVEKEDENLFYGSLASDCVRTLDFMFWVSTNEKFLKIVYTFLRKVDEEKWRLPMRKKRQGYDAIKVLLDVGIGEKNATRIVDKYKSLQAIGNLSKVELEDVMTKQGAKKVYEFFRRI